MCNIIRKICTNDCMFKIEDKRIDILLEGLTASPLISKFKSILKTTNIYDNPEVSKLIEIFRKQFIKAIEIRNELAHGTFFAGDALGNVNNFELRKPKLTNNGYTQNVVTYSIASLQELNDNIMNLDKFIGNLQIYLSKNAPDDFRLKIFEEMRKNFDNIKIELKEINKSIEILIKIHIYDCSNYHCSCNSAFCNYSTI